MEAFNKDYNQSWVADRLGTTRQNVNNRVIYMRSKGVRLPDLAKNRFDSDVVAKHNAYIEAHKEVTKENK